MTQFKVQREQERLVRLQENITFALAETERQNQEKDRVEKKAKQAKTELRELAPMLKKMESLAREFSDDPGQVLPEAGTLESAKSYREKKVRPILTKIVKVLRSVYRAYLDLKCDFSRLQERYSRAIKQCDSFSVRLDEVIAENKFLRNEVRDYERVKRALGIECISEAVKTERTQEQAQKQQKENRNRERQAQYEKSCL